MIRRTLFPLAAAAVLFALPTAGRAQEKPRPETTTPEAKPETAKEAPKAETTADRRGPQGQTLRVQLVITRTQGEKKLASLPYMLVVATGGPRTRMRMGVDTPVPVQMLTPPSEGEKPKTSFQYKTVGTNIDCAAWVRDEGRYQLSIGVESSSALTGAGGSVEGAPLFRRFDTNVEAWLRDGQSVQTIASTDPVTGEVVKIDVTLNVVR
jgi:hypothetical protein